MRYRWPAAILTALFCVLVAQANPTDEIDRQATYSRRNPVVDAVKKTRHAIVTIKASRPNSKDMTGTGVIVDERGILVTNRHVVGGNRNVRVLLYDGSEMSGQVIAAESECDLAIVQIRTQRVLTALSLAPVDDLMVGENVIAIGHPFGYSNTVSTGIISALGREITMPTGDVLTGLIQTSAPINPGNSGGPLLNINGELIGINVALRDGAQGIAFAINAGTVKQLLNRYCPASKMAGVIHGLKCEEKVIGEVGLRQRVFLQRSPANCTELKPGDEILTVGERMVTNSFDVERALWGKKPGEKVALKIHRDGQEVMVSLVLQPVSGTPAPQVATGPQEFSSTADARRHR